ncbi:hypothetical protein DMN50_22865, partial [Priestia megaterium]
NHIGLVKEIGAPLPKQQGYLPVDQIDVLTRISSEDSRKKADVYLNGLGVSIKQSGGSFSFNRLQRANLKGVFEELGFSNANVLLNKVDDEVNSFHNGLLETRNRPWAVFFEEQEFKLLLRFLMCEGSPNYGRSVHPANYILEAPSRDIDASNINVYKFDEYFEKYKDKFKIAIRRQWIGQGSKTEHKRASGLIKKEENLPWAYDDVIGMPTSGWMDDFPEANRKTVYFLMIEKVR